MTEEIITDYRQTVQRLQEELKEKSDMIFKLMDYVDRLEQENKELKEWKERVVKLFESACRCKYLNEESDICSYTNKKCININKCVYKYQELSDIYRSALEEIREVIYYCGYKDVVDKVLPKINEVLTSLK